LCSPQEARIHAPLICASFEIILSSPQTNQPKAAFLEGEGMRSLQCQGRKAAALSLVFLALLQLGPFLANAQNLGGTPQVNKAVQGQTAAQPEGAFLNLVNWIGNVICPVGAALCVVMAVVNYTHGRGVARWAVAAAGLLLISGLTRLVEFWIANGQSGVQ
jgi:hypothetical protein